MVATAIIGAGVAGAGASLAGASIQAGAATSAADTQSQTALAQMAQQQQMFEQVQGNLAPYMNFGNAAHDALGTILPSLVTPYAKFQPNMAQLAQTPGYQFTLQQGEQATQNAQTANGLGVSGSAMKAGEQFAEGLASQTYQQQFQNYQQEFQNYLATNQQTYNMFSNITQLGENAAAGVGQMGMQSQSAINNLATSGAAAQAAGQVGAANAYSGALNNIGNSASNYGMFAALSKSGMFGNTGSGDVSQWGGPA